MIDSTSYSFILVQCTLHCIYTHNLENLAYSLQQRKLIMYTQRMKVNSNNVHVHDVVWSYERMDLMAFITKPGTVHQPSFLID